MPATIQQEPCNKVFHSLSIYAEVFDLPWRALREARRMSLCEQFTNVSLKAEQRDTFC